jgi:hypothetical protein
MVLQFILTPLGLYIIALTGMFTHFLKLNITGETLVDIKNYFNDHFRSTLVAFIATSVGFLGYYFMMASGTRADVAAVFALGYMFDSFFNKFTSAAK